MKKKNKHYAACLLLGGILWLLNIPCHAQQGDVVYVDTVMKVSEVVVRGRLTIQEVVPSQKLSGAQLERLNTHSIADALRYFSGLQLKDYGGVGGIKTVNIRSMGTNHLGIYYDGIELGNAQNGQIDLGQFSLDNVQEISLYNGQRSAIFQTASDFGNAGSVYIRTRLPRFKAGEKYHMKWKVKHASSNTWHLSGLYEQRLTDKVSASLSGGYLRSNGKYKFRYRRLNVDRSVAYDTTATRQNGDIWAWRLEGNVHGFMDGGYWNVKGYTYNSERGIPGAIVNNVWRRGERQWDHNYFTQATWQRNYGERFSTRLMAKYAFYDTRYVNNDSTQMRVDNRYKQQEAYFSTSNVYEILPSWSVSLAYDMRWNKLNADVREFVYPTRWSHLVALATALDLNHVKVQGSILGNFVKDRLRYANDPKAITRFTPALFASWTPFDSGILTLRAFVKRSFRMPTFNDLYYTEIGNALLRPESALQYNVGMTLKKKEERGEKSEFLQTLRLQTDVYYNSVHDKIVAYPKGQQFRWTMLNLGRVHIKGVDVEAEVGIQPVKDLIVTGRLQYTYQDARDVTDPKTSYYRDQIPYIPWHSGSAIVNITYKDWDFTYSFIYAGKRYNQQENIRFNYMQPWYTNDISLMYRFRWSKTLWKATLEVNNIFDQDYDVILNYPMPKRNYGISLDVTI